MGTTRISPRLPKVPSGLYGEIVVAEALDALGFDVEMLGGGAQLRDGFATRDDLRLDVQVKCTARKDAGVIWRRDGTKARLHAETAEAAGRVAVMVFCHATSVPDAIYDGHEIRLPRPTFTLYATYARTFADDVDKAREWYSQQPYTRGARKGELKSADAMIYPLFAVDYEPLADFIDGLSSPGERPVARVERASSGARTR